MSRYFLGASALVLLSCPAAAQPTPPIDEGWTPDIVVTAPDDDYVVADAATLRTPVPIMQTPQSIQVLTRRLIDDQQLRTLDEALANVSGVVPSLPSEIVLANPIVRGFEAEIFTDGLIGYGDTAVIDPSSLWHVERIEVAKGPTSTLYGGGTGSPVGGLVNLVTRTANDRESFALQLRGGSFSSYSAAFDANRPLSSALAVRLVGEAQDGGDAIDRVTASRLLISPSLRLTPSSGTDVVGRLTYSRVEQLEYAGLPAFLADNPAVRRDRFTGSTNTPQTTIENLGIDLDARQRIAPGVTAALRVRRYENDFTEYTTSPFFAFFPCSGTICPLLNGILPAKTDEWTVDGSATAEATTGPLRHTLIAGVQWDRTEYRGATGFDFANLFAFDYADPTSDFTYRQPPLTQIVANRYETLGVYAQDQLTIADRVHILASLRYSRLAIDELQGGSAGDQVYHEWDPRIGVTIDIADGFNLFAGYATGSRLSVFFNGTDAPRPERSESYEGGAKLALTNIGLSGTIAAFYIERTNVPSPDPTSFFTSIQTGRQRSRGVEADIIFEPGPALSLLASYAYTDAEVTADTVIPVGSELPRVPRHRGRVAARYRFVGGTFDGFEIGAGVSYSSRAQLTLPNRLTSNAYTVADAQVSYRIGAATVGLRVDNLFDADYLLPYQYFAQDVVRPGTPRSAFVTLGFSL